MRFTKMQGIGNDYIYVNCFEEQLTDKPSNLARRMSDRRFGVGSDGLILICPSEAADARMRMFNADGSESEMCGNGIRCVAKYLYEHGIAVKPQLKIETGAGVLTLDLELDGDRVRQVRTDLGEPILQAAKIPTTLPGDPVVNAEVTAGGRTFPVTCVSMGNPHAVVFVEELSDDWVLGIGPLLEKDAHFPNRVNAHFVQVLAPTEVRQRTWERGTGETLACGTGASAVCVAGVLTKKTERKILMHLVGGDLTLEWNADDNHVYKTGPAVEVFTGEWQER